jgi:hypothetical protein
MPYVLCPPQMGFLYLRFLLNPRTIWEWIEGYLGDREVRLRA